MLGTQCHFPRDADGRPSRWHRCKWKATNCGERGSKVLYPKAALHLHQKVPSSMHWRVGLAGEPILPLRTASGPQNHALRGKDDHFLERSHPLMWLIILARFLETTHQILTIWSVDNFWQPK